MMRIRGSGMLGRAAAPAVLLACLVLGGPPALAAIGFVSASSISPNVSTSITIPGPAGMAVADVMLAQIAHREGPAETITPPAGWNLVSRLDNNEASDQLAQSVYWKVVTAAEPASYTFTLSANRRVAGIIAAYRGVETLAPINVFGGQVNASSVSVTAPSITTTVADTMLVGLFATAYNSSYTAFAGMTSRQSIGTGAGPNGTVILATDQPWPVAGATGTRTATAANAALNIGHLVALLPIGALTPGGFNAYETSTAAGAITGVIKTKVSGSVATVDIVVLNALRTAILTTFTGTVRVEILNSSDNSGALDATTGCRASWTTIQTLAPDTVFVAGDNGRKSISFTVPEAYRDARIRVTFPVGAPTATGCSTDNFAIRPAALANVNASDTDWQTAGVVRALDNAAAVGGNVHKAAQPFTLRATAQNALAATTANYNGSPTLATIAFTLPALALCPTCSLAPGAWSGSGTVTSTTAVYSEAGAIAITLEDSAFAAVDAADSTLAERTIAQSVAATVGRFVPDRFVLTTANAPQYRTFNATDASCSCPDPPGCVAPKRTFTYIGQPFGWVTAPQALITAQNASGATTANYQGALWKIAAADVTETYVAASGTLDSSLKGTPVVASNGDGTGTTTSLSTGTFAFVRDAVAPQAAFNANITLTASVQDASENTAGQGIIGTLTPAVFSGAGAGIVFDGGGPSGGTELRYGRLSLSSAYGSEGLSLPVPLAAQYWSGFGFVLNSADNCTTIAAANVKLSGWNPAGFSASLTQANVSVSGAFTSGRANLKLLAPGARGSAQICVDLDPGAGLGDTTCEASTPANRAYLQVKRSSLPNYDKDPFATVGFGVYKGPDSVIYRRENY